MPGNGQIEHHYGISRSLAAELFFDVCRAAVMGGRVSAVIVFVAR
jgi:hypothetical protein